MRFFPHAVKQLLLGMELKRETGNRQIESLSNPQISKKPVHIGFKIIFSARQRKLLVDNSNLAEREF